MIPVRGWFQDSLPKMVNQYNVKEISFLRLDGDLYISTYQPLLHLYPKISPGGVVYVDDYFSFNGCRTAVDVFRAQNNITAKLYIQPFYERGDISTTDPEAGQRQLIERMLILKYGFNADIPAGEGKTEAVWWRKE
jgi:Macrocin-O-methyltransferase (TylF)